MSINLDKWDERYLSLAAEVASWSKDPGTKVGAVIVGNKKEVLSQGFNGFPRGMKDLCKRYADRNIKYKYTVHAEMNAIYNATYRGVSLDNSVLYIYGLPICYECAKGIIQVGIKRVVIKKIKELDNWNESAKLSAKMLAEVGVSLIIK